MCLLLLYKQTHVHKEKGAVHTNEEKYKEEIIKFITNQRDELYYFPLYIFPRSYVPPLSLCEHVFVYIIVANTCFVNTFYIFLIYLQYHLFS